MPLKFFDSLDYENSKNEKPKAALERHQYVQRASDWDRWSRARASKIKASEIEAPEIKAPEIKAPEIKAPEIKAPKIKAPEVTVCPVYIKIDEANSNLPSKDFEGFVNETDKAKVLRNEQGDLFVRMDALLGQSPLYDNFDASIKGGEQPPEVFLEPIKDFFKKYVLWKLPKEEQDKMSEDMIKHFHQGGVCTVASRGLTEYMGRNHIQFPEAKQKMLFEATNDGFKFSERNKYYRIVDTSSSPPVKDSDRSFLSTRVDLSVKSSKSGNGISIDKVIISAKSEVVEQFPEIKDIEVGLFQKIWDMIKSFFGAKNTAEITNGRFIHFSAMEENENRPIAGPHPGA